MNGDILVQVRDLRVYYSSSGSFFGRSEQVNKAVDGVSFTVKRGQTTGLVGESGSGKTTIGRALVRLAPVTGGEIFYEKTALPPLSEKAFFPYRKRMQMIFQDPFNSLNPRMTVADILEEPLRIHFPEMKRAARQTRTAQLLEQVGLSPDMRPRYPHEFSGGQRQRIGIARALAVEPEFIVCDEPVSALDVSVQAQIVNLLKDLQKSLGLAYLFIAHDLAVVEHMADELLVMTQGKIVERGHPKEVCAHPKNEYTKKLIAAVPRF